MVSVTLPYPPSANRLWRFVPGQANPLKSTAYRMWLAAAKAECRGLRRVNGPFIITIVATRPDNRARDLDNLAKPTLDALKGIAFEDDSLAQSIWLSWSAGGPVKGGSVAVTVEAYQAPARDGATLHQLGVAA
jgi:crossover junction endodeoxyribonuclease RusA